MTVCIQVAYVQFGSFESDREVELEGMEGYVDEVGTKGRFA